MVEGVRVEEEAVLGAGVVLTASTVIVDVTGPEPVGRPGPPVSGAIRLRPVRAPPSRFVIESRLPSSSTKSGPRIERSVRRHWMNGELLEIDTTRPFEDDDSVVLRTA